MHARSENLHDCARSAPEICAIFEKRTLSFSYFQKPLFMAGVVASGVCEIESFIWTSDPLLGLPQVIHNTTFPLVL